MDGLGVLRPDDIPHATAYIPDMVDLVGDLLARAWPTRRPTASTSTSTRSRAMGSAPRASTRSGPEPGWRATRRSDHRSTSSCGRRRRRGNRPGCCWGTGRPGWHTECVVMSSTWTGRRVRPARRGPGPGLPPSRERAGPGGRRRPHLRPSLGAQRLGRGRGHEDVQVARQLHLADRPARPMRRPGLPPACPAGPLPLAHRGDPGHPGRRREGARPSRRARPGASTTSPAGWDTRQAASWSRASNRRPGSTRGRWRRSGRAWTTTWTRPGPWPASSSWCRRRTAPPMRVTRSRVADWPARPPRWPPPGALAARGRCRGRRGVVTPGGGTRRGAPQPGFRPGRRVA